MAGGNAMLEPSQNDKSNMKTKGSQAATNTEECSHQQNGLKVKNNKKSKSSTKTKLSLKTGESTNPEFSA